MGVGVQDWTDEDQELYEKLKKQVRGGARTTSYCQSCKRQGDA